MNKNEQKIKELEFRLKKMKDYRDELNNTNDDTLSLDQNIERLEEDIETMKRFG